MNKKRFFKYLKKNWKYARIFLIIMGVLSILSWATQINDYYLCLDSNLVEDGKCVMVFLLQEPHVDQVRKLIDGCQSENIEDCLGNAGTIIYQENIGEFMK